MTYLKKIRGIFIPSFSSLSYSDKTSSQLYIFMDFVFWLNPKINLAKSFDIGFSSKSIYIYLFQKFALKMTHL